MSRSTDKPKSLQYLPGIAVLSFAVAGLTQGYKQVVAGPEILERGERSGKYIFTDIDEPTRGSIYSADGEIIAQNEDSATVGIRFDRVPNSVGFYMAVSEATGIPAASLEALAADPKIRSREWRYRLTPEQVRTLEKVRFDWRADGLSINGTGAREYPLGSAASSVVGGILESGAKFGIENSFNKFLEGTPGKKVGMTDRDGSFLPMRLDRSTVKRVDGESIVLTIDSELQETATQAVRKAVEANKADSGVAIVYDPATGNMIAMANWPSFDPEEAISENSTGEIAIGMNPNYMLAWEPGSTFKILTLAKGLDMGLVKMSDRINCAGTIQVWPGRKIGCAEHQGKRAHGTVDSTGAIARSCNVCAAIWAKRIGHENMTQYMKNLGLLDKTKMGLPGERAGTYLRDEYAKGLQLALFGFGQSVTVTPVGLVSAFGTLANHGLRMEPRIIDSIANRKTPIKEGASVLSEATCNTVLESMIQVLESDHGTGKSLKIPGYELGGKTGTAQKINQKTGTVEGGGYVSSFVGFVPAKQPRAVILVMVDNPKVKHFGAEVAGPVFVEVAKKTIERLHIPKANLIAETKRDEVPQEDKENVQPQAAAKAKPKVSVDAKPVLNKEPVQQVQTPKPPISSSPIQGAGGR